MIDTPNDSPEEFAPTREHEYQDSHYHDEEPDVQSDDSRHSGKPPGIKKPPRKLPPPRRHYED